MITTRALQLAGIAGVSLALAGCGLSDVTPTISAPPAPVVAAPVGPRLPTADIAASPETVKRVLVERARAKGATPTLAASAVILQRQLPSTNEALAAACGPQVPGRVVRVVLGTQPIAGGTRVTEERYIVDGPKVCSVPLSEADIAQSEASLAEVKAQAEQRFARR